MSLALDGLFQDPLDWGMSLMGSRYEGVIAMPEIRGNVGHGIECARQLSRDPVFREAGLLAPAEQASFHIP